jgi:hypothetical protein
VKRGASVELWTKFPRRKPLTEIEEEENEEYEEAMRTVGIGRGTSK